MSKKIKQHSQTVTPNLTTIGAANSAFNGQQQNCGCRPRDHLVAIGKKYPAAWRQASILLGDKFWPNWCFLPMGAWHAIVFSEGGSVESLLERIVDVGSLSALGNWRPTQGVYQFDPTLYRSVIETPIDGDLPHQVLFHLPEWCVYINTPELSWCGSPMHGFFAHLEWDANTHRHELRFLIDRADGMLIAFPIHLGAWSLADSISRVFAESDVQASKHGMLSVTSILKNDAIDLLSASIEPMISLLLYLCTQNAEITSGSSKPSFPEPKRTKKGLNYFPPDSPTTWDVGVRLGSAIRKAYQSQSDNSGSIDGNHASPRPHIRRAHWHGFRSGPKKNANGEIIPISERRFDFKWLPPIPVNLDTPEDLPVTVHPVKLAA